MTFAELLKAILENGLMAVATTALIFVYLKNEKDRSKRASEINAQREREWQAQNNLFTKMLETQTEQIETQSKQISQFIQTNQKTHGPEEDEFQEKINKAVDDILKSLRESTGGCRAMLVKYHNGLYDLIGNSAAKMSATNEDVAIGIQPFLPFFQNQFRGLLTYWCSQIRDSGFCFIADIEELKKINENSMYEFLKGRNVCGWYGRAIYDNNKSVIGFIVVEYIADVCVSPTMIEACLLDKATKISALLSLDKGGWKK